MFRNVQISAVLNGWVVQCGCQTLVFSDRNDLLNELNAYLKDPTGTEARFLKTSVNAAITMGAPPIEAAVRREPRDWQGQPVTGSGAGQYREPDRAVVTGTGAEIAWRATPGGALDSAGPSSRG